jgi:Flp pilus assembly secretin CpaC
VVVEQPTTPARAAAQAAFPAESIGVAINADAIILSGRVSSTEVMLRAAKWRARRPRNRASST